MPTLNIRLGDGAVVADQRGDKCLLVDNEECRWWVARCHDIDRILVSEAAGYPTGKSEPRGPPGM
jgi:hypothetical protein